MFTIKELKRMRLERDISLRDIQQYADGEISFKYISEIENGMKSLTKSAHDKIKSGIYRCYFAKLNGTYHRDDMVPPDERKKPGPKPKGKIVEPRNPTIIIGEADRLTKDSTKKCDNDGL